LALLAFLILVWERASGIDADEKKELALLRAVGWQVTDVLWMKLWQGLMVAFTATLQGVLLAYCFSFIWQAPFLRYFFAGWSVLYPHYQLQPVWELSDLMLVVTVSLIPYLSATLYPAWRGAIIPPAEAMQKS
jgi:ABC-type lipoprotein release transport system permease subunit